MRGNWYSRVFRKLHFDMHTPEEVEDVGRDFDPEAFAESVASSGAEAVCFFARCTYGWSYYPTRIGVPHPHLTCDLFGEGLQALQARGLKVIAYYSIDHLPPAVAAAHPEWCAVDADGKPVAGNGNSTATCIFRGFSEELMIPQFREIAERYPVDGFFLDGVYMFFHRECHCERCREALGGPIPTAADDPRWRRLRHLQVQRVHDVFGRAAEAVAQVREGCLLGVNWLASVRWSVPPPRALGYLTGDPPLHNASFETAYNLAAWAWREQPADLMTERMLHHWQDFTCRTPETLETEFATGLACGGRLFVGDLLKPVAVRPDPEVMRLLKRSFGFAAERESLTAGARPRADIAILSSPETIRGRGSAWAVDDAPLQGALLAVIEAGLTADILYDADLAEHLGRYELLVIPEQPYLTRAAARAVAAFVASGGGVVITGCLPRAVDPEEPDEVAEAGPLEALTRLRDEGRHEFSPAYLLLRGTAAEGLWRAGDDFRPAIPVPGASARVRANGAEVLAWVTAPGQAYQIGALPPGETLDFPALAEYAGGGGRVAFCALPLAGDFWRRGNPGAKYVLQGLLRRAARTLTTERLGPPSVQLTRLEGEGRTVLHLVAYQPDRRTAMPQVIESPAEVTGVRVRIKTADNPTATRAEPQGLATEATRDGEWLTVEVPPFRIHTAVVLEWH